MLRPADLVTSIARETQMHLTRKRVKCTMYGVLSVAKLTPGQEGYYERSVAAGIDDYYAGRGESPGIWTGTGAAAIGLEGVVEGGQLGTLIRGDHPHTGDRLRRRHPKARTITVEKIDPASGERRLDEKTLRPVAGFDLVFSPPKSVSLLHALGDEDTRRAVNEAHTSAWQAALAYLEEEACVVRRGTGGVAREHGEGFVAAAYQHRTSRAQDPHLHTHVIVANMARRPSDGKWRALDGEAILKTYRLAAGYLYQAHLRAELSRSLGVEWETPHKGLADLKGVPRRAIEEFSTRRAQVVEHMDEQGTSGFWAAQVAALDTRDRKEHLDLAQLREEWRARAAEHGFGRKELAATMHRVQRQEPSSRELLAIARRLLGPDGLTEHSTAFSDPNLVMAWSEAHAQGGSADRIRRLAARFTGMDGVEPVGEAPQPGRPSRYSTRELIATERAALALVERGISAGAPAVPGQLVDAIALSALSEEQQRMLQAVATSPDRVVCVVGLAGSGKTTATRALVMAFQAAGVPVLGAAPSGIAAEKLQHETSIRSTTLHRLLQQELPERCLVVVDEAGMADTRVLAPLLERIEQAHGKIVLIGDPGQLPAVGAGGLFTGIVERRGAIKLGENRRQVDAEERRALEAIRNGLGRDYLAFAEGKGRLIASDTPTTAKTRLLADWWAAARDDLPGNIMIALRRRDVAELNVLARALMDSHGRLGRDRVTIAGSEFASGDRIVCLRNSEALTVRNGTRATVETVDRKHRTLAVVTDRGDRLELSRDYLEAGHVRHAYALTGHASQGVTVERAFVLGSDGVRLQEWGYVALSRARQQTRLYVTATPRERESHFHDLDDRNPITRLGQALEESAIERLAVDQQPLPSGPLHDTRAEIEQFKPNRALREQLRHIEQRRLAITKARHQAEDALRDAEHKLDGLGLIRRGRRRQQLLEVTARCRAAVQIADRLSGLADEARDRRNAQFGPQVCERPAADISAERLGPELDDLTPDF
jgi:conjugative relaxase-like TrwC/TraI family protein